LVWLVVFLRISEILIMPFYPVVSFQ